MKACARPQNEGGALVLQQRSRFSMSAMDWDKLKVFHAAAEAGSFTHAGEQLGLSQSAVSRQVSALEQALNVSLFHRHARGLILTEQGELLYRTAHEVFMKLESARAKLTDSRERPNGDLKVTTTVGLGNHWLTPKLGEFIDLYPDIRISLITTDEELDLAMREADVAIRLHWPDEADLIQRRLFTVHYHACASTEYIKRFGEPQTLDDLENHRLITLSDDQPAHFLKVHRFLTRFPDLAEPRQVHLCVNDAQALRAAVVSGAGIGMVPDHASEGHPELVQLLRDYEAPSLDCYFVYPEEMRSLARLQVFRDFLLQKAQRWAH
jgi:DNA-binding transcriptional LysR family regulator